MSKSILNPTERQQYSVGSVAKLAKPLFNLFEDSSKKAMKSKMNSVHNAVEKAVSERDTTKMKKSDIFRMVAEDQDVTVKDVENIEKVFARRAGGGGKENLLGEVAQTIRATLKSPTELQKIAEDLGGGKLTKEARKSKGKAVLTTAAAGLASTGVAGVGGYLAGLSDSQKEKVKENKTSTVTDITSGSMKAAFSKASKNPTKYVFIKSGQPYFKYKGQDVPFSLATEEEDVVLDMTPRIKKDKGGDVDPKLESFRQELLSRVQMPSIAPTANEEQIIKEQVAAIKNMSYERLQDIKTEEEQRKMDAEMRKAAQRVNKQEGGSMLVPPEMPVDTYTPEEQANAEESQVSDEEMEDNYMNYVLDESLGSDEQDYLMNALESDPKLSEIFDKVITTASEFSGAGEVEGPGTGVSDSIPARLSDGEFVITRKATDEIGADNLQMIMDQAEREADYGGGMLRKAVGGLLGMKQEQDPTQTDKYVAEQDVTEDEINKSMLAANRMPSLQPSRLR
jgi:hypothetical protein